MKLRKDVLVLSQQIFFFRDSYQAFYLINLVLLVMHLGKRSLKGFSLYVVMSGHIIMHIHSILVFQLLRLVTPSCLLSIKLVQYNSIQGK